MLTLCIEHNKKVSNGRVEVAETLRQDLEAVHKERHDGTALQA